MTYSLFPYPGGKYYISDWVISHFPDHECYVEPFSGSATVLFSKPPSRIEVINDRDDDVIHFFNILKNRPNELEEWLSNTPFSRSLHDDFATEYYNGNRSSNDIDRAGRFFYLRFSQFASKYNGISGFKTSSKTDCAAAFKNTVDGLDYFIERLRSVVVENSDFEEIFTIYDQPETLFYCDPPYVNEGDAIYTGDAFDHERFVKCLSELDGYWIVSYTDLPNGIRNLSEYVVDRSTRQRMNNQRADRRSESRVERLVMNFDPRKTSTFVSENSSQSTLPGVSNE